MNIPLQCLSGYGKNPEKETLCYCHDQSQIFRESHAEFYEFIRINKCRVNPEMSDSCHSIIDTTPVEINKIGKKVQSE